MSYILDALKKADAERERGTVPGLHSQALGQVDDDEGDSHKAIAPAIWISSGVGICLLGILSWQLLTREAPPASAVPTPELASAARPPAPQALPDRAAPYPPPPAPTSHKPMAERTPARAPLRDEPKAPASSGATATALQSSALVSSLNELPEDVRRDLPQLVIGGAMYSDTPSSRMLIINSQVFHEGDQPHQGLTLEEIRLKSAIFKYRGYRYAINY
jgi:general secretion pathway protein B